MRRNAASVGGPAAAYEPVFRMDDGPNVSQKGGLRFRRRRAYDAHDLHFFVDDLEKLVDLFGVVKKGVKACFECSPVFFA